MQGMNGSMMVMCMVAATLFSLIVVVTLIVQAVLQAKILREIRKYEGEKR